MAKVLVVDDSLSVRKVVERALLAKQLEVVSAASGTEAIAQIERERPDMVVCDVVMPDRDGYEICRFVKGHPQLGRTPVLLISGIVNDGVAADTMTRSTSGNNMAETPVDTSRRQEKDSDPLGLEGAFVPQLELGRWHPPGVAPHCPGFVS